MTHWKRTLPIVIALVSIAVASIASPMTASADFSDVELAATTGLLDRTTSAAGSGPLQGLGYDDEQGLAVGGDLRLHFDSSLFWLSHGVRVGGLYGEGMFFGVGGAGYRWTQADVDYTVRGQIPCMSNGDVQVHVSGQLGITGAFGDARAGAGDATQADEALRAAAANELDQWALGLHLGVGADVSWDAFLLGVSADLREMGPVRGDVGRSRAYSLTVRLGVRLDLSSSEMDSGDYYAGASSLDDMRVQGPLR